MKKLFQSSLSRLFLLAFLLVGLNQIVQAAPAIIQRLVGITDGTDILGINSDGSISTNVASMVDKCPSGTTAFATCSGADITDTNSTAVKAATGSASTGYDIYHITVSNTDATVGTRVDILDGSTKIEHCPAAANFQGCSLNYTKPLVGSANTAINAQNSVTSAEVRVCVSGCISAR